MIEEIYKDVFKFTGMSNVYFLKQENILIDAGDFSDKDILEYELSKVISLDKIKTIILTHLHYDHIGNLELFKNAEIYASRKEIESLKKSAIETIIHPEIAINFNYKLNILENLELPSYLKVIDTPFHTKGSICIYDTKRKILFSGDTVFSEDFSVYGRMDLPTSCPNYKLESINKLKKIEFDILCAGHDY